MAKDRTPVNRGKGGPARGGSSAAGKGASAARGGSRGRTRPPTQVVTQPRRPWGLIAAAVAVVVFAVAAIGYALVQVDRANANQAQSADDIEGVQTFKDLSAGHVTTPVAYPESPPVGGPHDGQWADCTGTVYTVDIRNENAVHSLEHGASWITYDPARLNEDDIAALQKLVDGTSGTMLSPRPGLDAAVSVQSWGNQLKTESATDPRLKQFVDFFTLNADEAPEVGASCENPQFIQSPLVASDSAQTDGGTMPSDAPAPSSGSAMPSATTDPSGASEAPAS